MSNIKKDYIFYSIVIVFAMIFLTMTPQIKITNASFIIGPKTWPYTLLILLLVLGAYGIISSFFKSKKIQETEATEDNEDNEPERRLFKLSIPIVCLITVILYVLLLSVFGFILSSLIFLYGLSFLLGEKKQLNAIIFSIATTTVFVFLFPVLLSIPLPRGMGVFRHFSLLFY
ncbi:hypothetical protein CR203_14250 [Salipaludibacillus neizhouensis]|uniref:DUF1468 domain-containing protein n=1 Tax=Salipaludibacillus neizhouensis TaxID=885475 RepID=A0A3A9K6G8_9BACI|nr:tripartite tricarboxylate transporter TctB family protein [Salipaludibacillus neizhouensis]RKL66460.1 hypothetical protein CR203_14250 [Salipaludibacillus neizhouensis]